MRDGIAGHETLQIGRNKLASQMLEHRRRPEAAQIEVEVGMDGHEVADIDPGCGAAFV
jgi:hypothetical protein